MHFRKITMLGSLAFLALNAATLNAQATINKYTVSGSNFEELIAAIDQYGPDGSWGRTNHDWAVSYTMTEQDNKHKVSKVDVAYTVSIDMPVWLGYSGASDCMKSSWDDMYKKLKKHEDKHAELGSGVAKKIRQALLSIAPQDSKDELKKLINQNNNRVLKENRAKQEKFDSDTDHGRNAGSDSIVLKHC